MPKNKNNALQPLSRRGRIGKAIQRHPGVMGSLAGVVAAGALSGLLVKGPSGSMEHVPKKAAVTAEEHTNGLRAAELRLARKVPTAMTLAILHSRVHRPRPMVYGRRLYKSL